VIALIPGCKVEMFCRTDYSSGVAGCNDAVVGVSSKRVAAEAGRELLSTAGKSDPRHNRDFSARRVTERRGKGSGNC